MSLHYQMDDKKGWRYKFEEGKPRLEMAYEQSDLKYSIYYTDVNDLVGWVWCKSTDRSTSTSNFYDKFEECIKAVYSDCRLESEKVDKKAEAADEMLKYMKNLQKEIYKGEK